MAKKGTRLTEEMKEKIRQAQLALHRAKPKVDPSPLPRVPIQEELPVSIPVPKEESPKPQKTESPSKQPRASSIGAGDMSSAAEDFYAKDAENVKVLKQSPDFLAMMSKYGLSEKDDLFEFQAQAHTIFERMSSEPLLVDTEFLKTKVTELSAKVTDLQSQVDKAAGRAVNLDDTASYHSFLKEDLKIMPPSTTKDGAPRYTVKLLEPLRDKYPALGAALDYRQAKRALSTAIKYRDSFKGEVRMQVNPYLTATGRIYTEKENIQGVPEELRGAIIPPEGYDVVVADYKANEYRILVAMAGDSDLRNSFNDPSSDPHRLSMSKILGIPQEEVTDEMRKLGKVITFSLMFSGTAKGLAQQLDISEQKAQTFIDKYFEAHPKVAEYMRDTIELASETNEVYDYYGRRWSPDWNEHNVEGRIVNFRSQSTAASILLDVIAELKNLEKESKYEVKMALPLHDSLLFFVKRGSSPEYLKRIKTTMEKTLEGLILAVDFKRGSSWGAVEKFEP